MFFYVIRKNHTATNYKYNLKYGATKTTTVIYDRARPQSSGSSDSG